MSETDLVEVFSILRIRPPELSSDGPPRQELLDVAAAALGLANPASDSARSTTTFLLPASVDLNPFDEAVIDQLTDNLHRSASDAEAVIVDLRFDRTKVRFGAVERLLVAVAGNIAPVWAKGAYLVLLVDRLPDEEDDLFGILAIPELEPFTLFVDEYGITLGSAAGSWGQADAVAKAATPTATQERDAAKRKARRRRGVFKVATSSRSEYSAHKYSLPSADLSRLLQGYFRATGVGVAVLDGFASPWLDDAVLAVGAERASNVKCFSSFDLAKDTDSDRLNMHDELRLALAEEGSTICLVVPMVKQGSRLRELLAVLSTLGRPDVQVLSVFVDIDSRGEEDAEGWSSRTVLGDGTAVDYFFSVELRRLLESDWEVQMARFFGEDLEDSAPWRPSRTGLWTMLNERQATAAYENQDHGVLLRMDLDWWDASWLAECIIRLLDQDAGLTRANVLMVVPDDKTAIAKIAEALKTEDGVAIAAVSRDAINGTAPLPTKVREALVRHRTGEIVLVDESTARYQTMASLERMVFREIQRLPDRSVVVLELPEGNEPRHPGLHSMLTWRPINRDRG